MLLSLRTMGRGLSPHFLRQTREGDGDKEDGSDVGVRGGGCPGGGPGRLRSKLWCDEVPCPGNPQKDTIRERAGDGKRDIIRAEGADDRIKADRYRTDADKLYGQGGNDRLSALDGDGRDYLNGGPGFDAYVGDRGDLFYSQCEQSVRL